MKAYLEGGNRFPRLYGLPQLKVAPSNKPIAIVEAPKTATICRGFYPQFVWLSVGALSYLSENRMADILGRKGILFPDRRGYENWTEKKAKLKALKFFEASDMLEQLGAEGGSDQADYLKPCVSDSGSPRLSPLITDLQRMKEANPALKSLVKVFGLISV